MNKIFFAIRLMLVATMFICPALAMADGVKKSSPIADLLVVGSIWNGRITFDAKKNGKDSRDWYANLHIMSVDGTNFKGRIDMGGSGHASARDLTVKGEIKDDTISFKSSRDGNFEITSADGKLTEPKTLEFTWKGNDGRDEPRTGKIKVTLKKDDDKKN